MIVVRVKLQINEHDKDTLLACLKGQMDEISRFKGCKDYSFYQDPLDPSRFFLYEEWLDRPSFDAYKRSKEFQETSALLFPMMVQKPDSAYYSSEKVGP